MESLSTILSKCRVYIRGLESRVWGLLFDVLAKLCWGCTGVM